MFHWQTHRHSLTQPETSRTGELLPPTMRIPRTFSTEVGRVSRVRYPRRSPLRHPQYPRHRLQLICIISSPTTMDTSIPPPSMMCSKVWRPFSLPSRINTSGTATAVISMYAPPPQKTRRVTRPSCWNERGRLTWATHHESRGAGPVFIGIKMRERERRTL